MRAQRLSRVVGRRRQNRTISNVGLFLALLLVIITVCLCLALVLPVFCFRGAEAHLDWVKRCQVWLRVFAPSFVPVTPTLNGLQQEKGTAAYSKLLIKSLAKYFLKYMHSMYKIGQRDQIRQFSFPLLLRVGLSRHSWRSLT